MHHCFCIGPSRSSGRKSFTLIELLVVVSVIMILSALLVPAYSSAMTSARSALCLGNVRQLQLMHVMYSDVNDGAFCPANDDDYNGWDSSADHTGPGILAQALSGIADASKGKIFDCPEAKRTLVFVDGWTADYAGFGYNYLLSFASCSYPAARRQVKIEEVTHPSECCLLADCASFSYGGTDLIPSAYLNDRSSSGGYADFRHGGKASVAYVDGHAAQTKEIFTRTSDGSKGLLDRLGYLSEDNGAYDPFFEP